MWLALKYLSFLFWILPIFFVRILWRLLDVFDGKLGAALRFVLIRSKLGACGDQVYLGPFIVVDDFSMLRLGVGVSIHHGVTILSKGGVHIGDNVAIAHGASIVSGNHTWDDSSASIKHNPVKLAPVRIDHDVWIGAGVRVLAGVTIGSRSVVAAGAVVNKSIDPGGVYGGVPARKIKAIV